MLSSVSLASRSAVSSGLSQRQGNAASLRSGQARCAVAAMASSGKKTVLVTGAGGRTGRLAFEQIAARSNEFNARALVRTEESKKALSGVNGEVFVADITKSPEELAAAFSGVDAVIILTSATPKMKMPPPVPPERPVFYYPEGGLPQQVDWIGQRNQIDAAKAAGVKHVVVVGSRGGTNPGNALNNIGGGGTNILLWKRKAEQYLVDSGLPFTIVRAGGLLDAEGGKRKLVVLKDDAPYPARTVPRADVAKVAVQAIVTPEARNKSLDLVSDEEGQGAPTSEWGQFFSAAFSGM